MRRIFELYGFQSLETPALERLEILMGKYGAESDKLVFKVMKRGEELKRALDRLGDRFGQGLNDRINITDLGLRFDLTVSLARVVAQHGDRLPKPFKRYQIAPVWRADRPQKGRYREFIQCDVDIVGTDSMVADAEIITMVIEVLRDLKLPAFYVPVNHRGLLKALSSACGNPPEKFAEFCTALDKLDKIGRDGVTEEMQARNLAVDRLGFLWELAERRCYIEHSGELKALVRDMRTFIDEDGEGSASLDQLTELFKLLNNLTIPENVVRFDPSLARGLDYYTGPVFEAFGRDTSIGSLGGGGRYDELIGMFSKQSIPATGTSFGLERIVDVMLEHGILTTAKAPLSVEIIDMLDSDLSASFCGRILRILRKKGVSCELGYSRGAKVGKQIRTADRRNVPFVMIIGEEEADVNLIGLGDKDFATQALITGKRLSDGEQRKIKLSDFIRWVKGN